MATAHAVASTCCVDFSVIDVYCLDLTGVLNLAEVPARRSCIRILTVGAGYLRDSAVIHSAIAVTPSFIKVKLQVPSSQACGWYERLVEVDEEEEAAPI